MWKKLAHSVLTYRVYWIIGIALITSFMAFHATKVEMSYDFGGVVPDSDSEMIFFQKFKKQFGEDGNILAIGLEDKSLFELNNFNNFHKLSLALKDIEGVEHVLSLPLSLRLVKNTKEKKFDPENIFDFPIKNQSLLDSLLQVAFDQKLYTGQLFNEKTKATAVLVSIKKSFFNSKNRFDLMKEIEDRGSEFTQESGIQLHYAGLPYVRTVVASKVKNELQMFLVLSLLVTGLILWVFFRSWDAVLFPLILIFIIVIWCGGTLALLGYKISMLTALIPPIIVVIGIPNSIYLLNKYHQDVVNHGDKYQALSLVIQKIGVVTLITNFTTAAGFIVLAFTDILLLKEFGTVTGINILATFFVSIIFIPAVFSFLPAPEGKKIRHLEIVPLKYALDFLDILVHRYPRRVFVVTGFIVLVSIFGLLKIKAVSYMVDDIPKHSQVQKDLRFFERNFDGIMPLQFVVDTGKPKGILKLRNLQKINEFENYIASQTEISETISPLSFIKAASQAYYNGNPKYYKLPTSRDKNFILRYFKNQEQDSKLTHSFIDSAGQTMRINCMVADVGSEKLGELLHDRIEPAMDRIFKDSGLKIQPTGTTLLFLKGNQFLIENLKMSMLMAFCIISVIMALLFKKVQIILISIIPNVVPLMITAGIMGYLGIPLKPSTALIFSITFGIAIDDSIHFLAKYRQELFANNFFVPVALSKSIRETGSSMIYTSIVLFFGFVIFSFSEFGGTQALGILTSITLLLAMLTNLILLPSLLIVFDNGRRKKHDALIEHYEDFYYEDEDEDIDLGLLNKSV